MIYVISWWMLLFMVLPFGATLPQNPDGNTYHSAPKRANIVKKMLITTCLATVATALIVWGISKEFFTLWFEPL